MSSSRSYSRDRWQTPSCACYMANKNSGLEPREMAPWLKAHIHTTLAEDLHLIPNTHIRWVILACNSGFKGFNSFLSLRAPTFVCTYPHTHVHIFQDKMGLYKDAVIMELVIYKYS